MMTEIPAVRGFIRMCTDGWEQGWHERNGGNLTYRMKPEEVEQCRPFFTAPREWNSMGVQADNLKGEYFITTGSGKFLRNVQDDPEHNIGIVEINDAGDSWRIVWGLENGARPTSEFPSHFMNHSVRKAATNGAYRVIYHAHTPNLIAMTYIMPLTARDFTRALWQSATECPVVFPGGVGVVPWMVPGGADIAMATSELMKNMTRPFGRTTACSFPDRITILRLASCTRSRRRRKFICLLLRRAAVKFARPLQTTI